MKSEYVPISELAHLMREQTPDERWLQEQVVRIDEWYCEMGNDYGYTRALEKLAIELRDKLREMGVNV